MQDAESVLVVKLKDLGATAGRDFVLHGRSIVLHLGAAKAVTVGRDGDIVDELYINGTQLDFDFRFRTEELSHPSRDRQARQLAARNRRGEYGRVGKIQALELSLRLAFEGVPEPADFTAYLVC